MRKLLILFATAALLCVGCGKEYDDSALNNRVDNLENRVAKLEELCKQMNTNISSLQTIVNALQNNDYVTSVTPVTNNGETIGYTIAFSKSAPITIYHGEKGEKGDKGETGATGAAGKAGHTPVIGVRQDTDGIYYWTLDGDWLLDNSGNKVKAEGRDGEAGKDGNTGADGQPGQPGETGQPGEPGTPGKDGKDGITPQLKIEDGYWYVSTDNGTTWTNLGKATGENGNDGAAGEDGDSFFQSVDTSDSDYVVFTLADGTEIKLPTWYAFEQLKTLCNQMNTNINALQAIVEALQNNDYVKSVTPVMQDGKEIGYTIIFSKSNPITIYHGQNGKDGANGADGKDGHTPIVGVRQDSDGIYYWTLDGEWLLDKSGNKVKAEGKDGANGKDGENGKDGQNGADGKDGENGKDGADGITPQLKIENGYWFVSTDNGATWTNLGKATGEDGKDGQDGIDVDSMFQSVTQDDDNVYFTLADDTIITVPKKSRLAISFAEGNELFFDVDQTITVHYTIVGGGNANVIKAELQNYDSNYTLYTTSSSATKGTIKITAKIPTSNRIIVSVSDGNHTIMVAISVGLKASFDGKAVVVETRGTLSKLIADYDKTTITELTVVGNLNSSDIKTLNDLPNLAVLDMVNVNLEELPDKAFENKTSLTDVKLPRTLKTICRDAFDGCSSLASINIPASVTTIGIAAFEGCSSLTSINIPASVTTIGIVAFRGCSSLTSVYITDIAKWSAIQFENAYAQPCFYAENLYLNGELIKDVVIPDSVTTIGTYAFAHCRNLTSVKIPDSVTTIGTYAFTCCRNLTSVTIPDSVTTIGDAAFDTCSSLTSVTIPDHVTTIYAYTFSCCRSLTTIYCKAYTPPSVNSLAFRDCSIWTLYVPIGCKEAYAAADEWKNAKEIIEMEF